VSDTLSGSGGRYVFISVLQELVVDGLHWIRASESIDGIALCQITPNPILISVTFHGYKVAGIGRTIIGTIAIFLFPGILIKVCIRFLDILKQSELIKAILKGIHPEVIGMIYAAY
jgi:chromate transporter